MTVQAINLQLPANLYQRLVEAAEASQQPLNEIVLQSIRVGLPPDLAHVPQRFQDDFRSLNQLSDELLWQIVQQDLADNKIELYEQLLAKNQQGDLNSDEQLTLDTLREEADLLMLRRSYAYTLLKWRGHRIPTVQELQIPWVVYQP